MFNPPLHWHKIADTIDGVAWQANGMAVIETADRHITLVRSGERLLACAHKCPHAGAVLADGFVDALGNVVCPLHKYRFSPVNGRNVSGEGYYLKTYPVEVRNDGVYVGV